MSSNVTPVGKNTPIPGTTQNQDAQAFMDKLYNFLNAQGIKITYQEINTWYSQVSGGKSLKDVKISRKDLNLLFSAKLTKGPVVGWLEDNFSTNPNFIGSHLVISKSSFDAFFGDQSGKYDPTFDDVTADQLMGKFEKLLNYCAASGYPMVTALSAWKVVLINNSDMSSYVNKVVSDAIKKNIYDDNTLSAAQKDALWSDAQVKISNGDLEGLVQNDKAYNYFKGLTDTALYLSLLRSQQLVKKPTQDEVKKDPDAMKKYAKDVYSYAGFMLLAEAKDKLARQGGATLYNFIRFDDPRVKELLPSYLSDVSQGWKGVEFAGRKDLTIKQATDILVHPERIKHKKTEQTVVPGVTVNKNI